MRHLKSGRKLGRTSTHRKALFRNLVTALIRRERIRTTLAKAKELRSHVEKTITLGKKGTLHAQRLARRVVVEKEAFAKLFGPLSERYAQRNGGYTRIIRLGHRRGDDAPMAFIELVDREGEAPEPQPKAKAAKKAAPKKETADKPEKAKEKKKETKKAEPKKDDKKTTAAKKGDKKKEASKKSAGTKKTATKKAATKKPATKKTATKKSTPKKK